MKNTVNNISPKIILNKKIDFYSWIVLFGGNRNVLSVLLLFVSIASSYSQIVTRQDKRELFKADNAYEYGDYLEAKKIYLGLYHLDSNNAEINFRVGLICYEIKKFRSISKKYLEKVPAGEFPEVSYYLGKLYHQLKDFEKANFYYNQYKGYKGEKDHSGKEINDLINKTNTAVLFESIADRTIKIKNVGDSINTEFAEYAPLIPADENFLLFTSRRKNELHESLDPLGEYFEDIYISYKRGLLWSKPVMLDTSLNTGIHDAGTGLSADGENMFVYRTGNDLISGNIYESRFENKTWGAPVVLGPSVNSEYLETSACYSAKGDVVYFSSNRPGGYGGKDLYRAKRLPNGEWGKPYNLGPKINTEYNEDAPFIHPLGNILYFSSEGHKNMGGFDVFKTNFDENVGFSVPENLGSPINTVGDDIFFVMNADGSKGYMSSGREGGFGSQDIYMVSLKSTIVPQEVYNIYVKNDSSEIVRNVEVQIVNFGEVVGYYKSNKVSGKVLVISSPQKEYQIIINADGYEPYTGKVKFKDIQKLTFLISKAKE